MREMRLYSVSCGYPIRILRPPPPPLTPFFIFRLVGLENSTGEGILFLHCGKVRAGLVVVHILCTTEQKSHPLCPPPPRTFFVIRFVQTSGTPKPACLWCTQSVPSLFTEHGITLFCAFPPPLRNTVFFSYPSVRPVEFKASVVVVRSGIVRGRVRFDGSDVGGHFFLQAGGGGGGSAPEIRRSAGFV